VKNTVEMQTLARSRLDESRICSYDLESVSEATTPLIHQEARFLYVQQGRGRIALQGREYPLEPGSLVAILPWQISEITQVESTLQYVLVIYHFDTVQRAMKLFWDEEKRPIPFEGQMETTPVVLCPQEQRGEADRILSSLHRELGMESTLELPEQRPFSSVSAVSLLVQLMVLFVRLGRKQTVVKKRDAMNSVEILRYMYLHCSEKLTLKQLSALFYCSESTVSAHITKLTGLSFFDLQNEMRVGKTVNFLLYTDLTLKEMAEILGYVDDSHISKVFAARVGMRIGEYRNIYRKVQNICRIEESRTGYTIVNEIYRNYEKPLTSELIARRFGISVTELNRLLLIQVERNFEDFLNLVRVNRACELLVETDRTVLEIAMDVGYRNPKTLTRNFLKLKLMTPTAFRAKLRA